MAYSDFQYVEIAKFVPKINAVIRVKENGTAVMPSYNNLDRFRQRHANKGVYTSVFRYLRPDLESPRCGPLYFDLDADNLSISLRDTRELYLYLLRFIPPEIITIYFTGSKGFHLEVSGQALGVGPSMNLAAAYRFIAERAHDELSIETIDFAVYEPRRMWRLPNSQHQKTGLFKVTLAHEELMGLSVEQITTIAQSPRESIIPNTKFNPVANEWLKSILTEMDVLAEEAKLRAAQRRIEMFEKYGSTLAEGPSKKYLKIVWNSVLKALQEAEPDKNRNIILSRQAYRMFMAVLDADDRTLIDADMDVETVTNRLYDIGIDMGLEPREVRATLNSALRGAEKKHKEEVYVGSA